MESKFVTCPLCKGEKVIRIKEAESEDYAYAQINVFPLKPCPECNGTGKVTLTIERCAKYNLLAPSTI